LPFFQLSSSVPETTAGGAATGGGGFSRVHRMVANNKMGDDRAPQPAMNHIQ